MVATTGKQWFGNETVISMVIGTKTHEVGIAKEIVIEFTTTDVKLYGCGSIMWQAVGRTEGDIKVSLKYAKIPAIADDLALYSINKAGPTASTIALDATSTSYPKFTLTSTVTSDDGLATRAVTLSNVYFPGYTWASAFSEFTEQTLDGSANDYSMTEAVTGGT